MRRFDPGSHLICEGELLSNAVAGLSELIAAELAHRPTSLVLDVSGVRRIDAAGADVLVLAASSAGENAVSLCLVGAGDGPVGTALTELHLMDLFTVHERVEDIDA